MKLTMTGKLLALCIAAMAFGMTGCSGGQEDDEKLAVSDEEAAAQGSAEASANGEAAAEDEADAEPAEAVAQDIPADDVPTPDAGATMAQGGGSADAGRVVRYVNASPSPLFNAASSSAGNVGQLVKGDRVMVVIEGGFGRIADGMFIQTDHLSAKPVARERKDAVWHTPAH